MRTSNMFKLIIILLGNQRAHFLSHSQQFFLQRENLFLLKFFFSEQKRFRRCKRLDTTKELSQVLNYDE